MFEYWTMALMLANDIRKKVSRIGFFDSVQYRARLYISQNRPELVRLWCPSSLLSKYEASTKRFGNRPLGIIYRIAPIEFDLSELGGEKNIGFVPRDGECRPESRVKNPRSPFICIGFRTKSPTRVLYKYPDQSDSALFRFERATCLC
jgi:hypothetical protein